MAEEQKDSKECCSKEGCGCGKNGGGRKCGCCKFVAGVLVGLLLAGTALGIFLAGRGRCGHHMCPVMQQSAQPAK